MTDWCRIGPLMAAVVVLTGCGAADQPSPRPEAPTPADVHVSGEAPGTDDGRAPIRHRSLARMFHVFASPREPADVIPGGRSRLDGAQGAVYLAEARRIGSATGTGAWLAPSDEGVCLVYAGMADRADLVTASCASIADAHRGRLLTFQPGPQLKVQGVAADDVASVTTGGARPARAPVDRNGFALTVSSGYALWQLNASGQPLRQVPLPRQMMEPAEATARHR